MMGRTCSVCIHPERDSIDNELVSGTPYRDIERRWHVSISALSRHRERHVSAALAAVQAEREHDAALSLLERVESLIERTERLLEAAESEGRVSAALAAVRERRGLLELLGKASGELDTRPQVTVNLLASPEWLSIREALFGALQTYPEARAVVAGRLLELEAAS